MGWWNRAAARERSKEVHAITQDKLKLIEEIRKAHTDWQTAQIQLNYVLDKDQIDYAIFALEAAEKRYEMLLRLAKKSDLLAYDRMFSKVKEA